ncbi:MAG: virulence RhuM family protein [Prevotella sp.]|nr:virulence RhuM family protein [Prevotella sp.]
MQLLRFLQQFRRKASAQNKMHYAVHGHTAAEIIYDWANAAKDFMGLADWPTCLSPLRAYMRRDENDRF